MMTGVGENGPREDRLLRVFVVEDSPVLQERLCEICTNLGRSRIVGYAKRARDAIALLEVLQPQFVIVDLWLEQGSGFEVMKWLQSQPPASRPVYAVFSSNNDQQHAAHALQLGAAAFFDKARDIMALVAFLRKVGDARHDLQQRGHTSAEQPDGPPEGAASDD